MKPDLASTPLPFRLGVVDYLNMQPLVAGLAEDYPRELRLRSAPPSRLADWLDAGEIDAGMVPVAAILTRPQWRVMTHGDMGSMIGCRGPVQSVIVAGHGDPAGWRRLRPDSHSMTSNLLARVILKNRQGNDPEPGEPMLFDAGPLTAPPPVGEAAVLIGSRALASRGPLRDAGATVLDLGAEWTAWTGLPFVFALWALRPGVDPGPWPERLEDRKRRNLAMLPEIAAAWPHLAEDGLTPLAAQDYLAHSIDFAYDGAAREGFRRFASEAAALGFVAAG